ncbi:hypothetical protein Tco_1168119 [Tanacetum coccineum]
MKQEDHALLDRKDLGVVRLSLAKKNIAFNVVNEKITFSLLKFLSNMYEKPNASNKVILIRQLLNTKMTEGATIADHVNEFNSVISKLLSVDIKFDDEMHALLLLDMILGEDIRMRNSGEYPNSLLSATGQGRMSNRGRSGSRNKSASENTKTSRVITMGKKGILERNIVNHELWIRVSHSMQPSAWNDEELQATSSKSLFGKYEGSYIVGIGDVVLKTTFVLSKCKGWELVKVRNQGSSKLVGVFGAPMKVTSRKAKVKRWMFKGAGVKAFSHVHFDEYICTALLEGLLIARKEVLACVETLYG